MTSARGFGTIRSWVERTPNGPVLHILDSSRGREATLELGEDVRRVWYLKDTLVYERKPDAQA